MTNNQVVEKAREHFGAIVQQQLDRVERLKTEDANTDFSKIKPIIIGVIGGDGIGSSITAEAQRVLEYPPAQRSRQRQGPVQGN